MNISVVMTGRNDQYGGDFIGRMERSLDSIRFPVEEVVIVEWMPPVASPTLAKAVRWPDRLKGRIRIITVPGEGPVEEYKAKNVGIRRATDGFVLVTNPDILFPDFSRSARVITENSFVRAIRLDLLEDGTNGPLHNNLGHTGLLTEAAGDFLMMTKAKWTQIGGFPEANGDAHADSYTMFNADAAGMTQVVLDEPIVHQWHPENYYRKVGFASGRIGLRNELPWGMEGFELPEERL